MSPQDRYQICGSVSGLIETASTKAEAFRIAEEYILRLESKLFMEYAGRITNEEFPKKPMMFRRWKIERQRAGLKLTHDCPIEVFDCFAHIGKPECWRYDDDGDSWEVVAIREA